MAKKRPRNHKKRGMLKRMRSWKKKKVTPKSVSSGGTSSSSSPLVKEDINTEGKEKTSSEIKDE